MLTILSQHFSLVNEWINELRNVTIQHDRMRFRRNMERIGEIAAFEISKGLEYREVEIQTPFRYNKKQRNCRYSRLLQPF